jgi:formylglycine-generating enzyme required for sulfatase activity
VRAALIAVVLTACGGAARGPVMPAVPAYQPIPIEPPFFEPPPAPTSGLAALAEPEVAMVGGCPEDMVAIEGFCIDRYEAPNIRGELPYALMTAYDGEAWCSARGKRLCTQDEWLRACEGPARTPRASSPPPPPSESASTGEPTPPPPRYPYGDVYRSDRCNDDKGWITVSWKALAKWPHGEAIDEATRLYQADMSGARAQCVSAEGVFDLTGNVAEWVRRSAPAPKPGYDHVLKGCYWAACYHEPRPNCEFTNGAHPGTFRTYEAGFRCCSKRGPKLPSPP